MPCHRTPEVRRRVDQRVEQADRAESFPVVSSVPTSRVGGGMGLLQRVQGRIFSEKVQSGRRQYLSGEKSARRRVNYLMLQIDVLGLCQNGRSDQIVFGATMCPRLASADPSAASRRRPVFLVFEPRIFWRCFAPARGSTRIREQSEPLQPCYSGCSARQFLRTVATNWAI